MTDAYMEQGRRMEFFFNFNCLSSAIHGIRQIIKSLECVCVCSYLCRVVNSMASLHTNVVNSHRSCGLVFTSINRSASSLLRIVMPILHRAITPTCSVLPSRGHTEHTAVGSAAGQS